jgi:chloramphenicol-sensitive protein RarD
MTQHGTPGLDRTGILAGSAAYLWWGLAAFYWVPAKVVPAVDLLAHRAFWAAPFCAVLLLARGRLRGALRVLRAPRSLLLLGCSSALVALNWGIFLHAMGQNRLAEASLGYFMQPLVAVLIGLVGFRERLTPLQWMSVGFAAAGVAVYTSALGHLPLVALGVSVSFGLYGAVRRLVQVDSLDGLFVETVLLAPFALGWILWQGGAGLGAHGHHVDAILLGAGAFTAIPLLGYIEAARRLPMIALGLLFYINPTVQLLVAVFAFGEPLQPAAVWSFSLVWTGVVLYLAQTLLRRRRLDRD